MDDRGSIPGRCNDGILSARQRLQTGSEAHPVSCPMGTGGYICGDKADGVQNWPLVSI
jgi:hypothetical protein